MSTSSDPQEMFLDILTKDEKEALVNKKMEEMRMKNEQLQKRHAEILADRQAAEKQGRAVSFKFTGASSPPKTNGQQDSENRTPSPTKFMTGVNANSNPTNNQVDRKKFMNRLSQGRGKRLANMTKEKLKAQEYDKQPSISKKTVPSEPIDTVAGGPPPDPGYSYLADNRRDGTYKHSEQESTRRHPRNWGGSNFQQVKPLMSQKRMQDDGGSKGDMTVYMTGQERRQYTDWKGEREKIDRERLKRQKDMSGEWKRPWDQDKIQSYGNPQPPYSQHLEPGRRQGRIGSGRFMQAERESWPKGNNEQEVLFWEEGNTKTHIHTGPGRHGGQERQFNKEPRLYNDRPRTDQVPKRQNIAEYCAENPKKAVEREHTRTTSCSSDEYRHVQEQNDSLVVKIENDISVISPPSSRGARVVGSGRVGSGRTGHGAPPPSRGILRPGARRGNKKARPMSDPCLPPVTTSPTREINTTTDVNSKMRNPKRRSPRKQINDKVFTGKTVVHSTEKDTSIQVPTLSEGVELEAPNEPIRLEISNEPFQNENVSICHNIAEEVISETQTVPSKDISPVEYVPPEPISDRSVNEEAIDMHNSSAESLDRFIMQNTLQLNTDATGVQALSPDSSLDSSERTTSDDSVMKTPVGHVNVLDWGVEMENYKTDTSDNLNSSGQSDAIRRDLSFDSFAGSDVTSPDKHSVPLFPVTHDNYSELTTSSELNPNDLPPIQNVGIQGDHVEEQIQQDDHHTVDTVIAGNANNLGETLDTFNDVEHHGDEKCKDTHNQAGSEAGAQDVEFISNADESNSTSVVDVESTNNVSEKDSYADDDSGANVNEQVVPMVDEHSSIKVETCDTRRLSEPDTAEMNETTLESNSSPLNEDDIDINELGTDGSTEPDACSLTEPVSIDVIDVNTHNVIDTDDSGTIAGNPADATAPDIADAIEYSTADAIKPCDVDTDMIQDEESNQDKCPESLLDDSSQISCPEVEESQSEDVKDATNALSNMHLEKSNSEENH